MKKLILLTILLQFMLPHTSSPQSLKSINVTGSDTLITFNNFDYAFTENVKNNFIIRDYYEFTDPSKPGQFKLPSRQYFILLNGNKNCTVDIVEKEIVGEESVIPAFNPEANLETDSSVTFTHHEGGGNYNKIKEWQTIGEINYFNYRNKRYGIIKINSHHYDPAANKLYSLKNLKLRLRFQDPSYINQPPKEKKYYLQKYDSTSKWIDYNSTYIKFSTALNTIYRITSHDMDSLGINCSTIDPRTIKIYLRGNEIPLYINGENDGSFDPQDYIEFFGGMNYPEKSCRIINDDNEEYNEFMNRYTDSVYFFLTWGGEKGKRIFIQKESLISYDTLKYYMNTIHCEKNLMVQPVNGDVIANQLPDWNKNKSWYWEWIYTGTKEYKIDLEDPFPGREAGIYVKYVSGGSNKIVNSHQLILKMNDTVIDSQSADRYKQVLLSGKISSGLLKNGENKMSVTNLNNGTNPNYLALDWYEIEYPKMLAMKDDSLLFEIDAGLSKGIKTVEINNAGSGDLILYKIKPVRKKIESFIIIKDHAVFTDTVYGGDQYIIISKLNVRTPEFLDVKKIANLMHVDNQAEYIAVTNKIFKPEAEIYADKIGRHTGLTARVINITDIYDQFSFGFPYPESMKYYLKEASHNWNAFKPKYLTLIGDADYDYKFNRLKYAGIKGGGNHIPSYGFPVSDNWFVCWDDSVSIPEMNVGRIPVNSPEELIHYMEKVENYFSSPMDDWNKRFIFFSGGHNTLADELAAFKNVNDSVINKYVKPAPLGADAVHFYKIASPRSDYGPFTPDQFSSIIKNGALVISYLGHSGTTTWDNGISETSQLKNSINRNPLMTDFGCSTNKFAEPDVISFGEKFLLDRDGDAIAYIGNSSFGIMSTSLTAPLKFYKTIVNNPSASISELLLQTKLDFINESGFSSLNKIFTLTNCLLGDPAIKLKIPDKPNLHLDETSLLTDLEQLNDSQDSVCIRYLIKNSGRAEVKKFDIRFVHKYNEETLLSKSTSMELPLLRDTISFWISPNKLAGGHELLLFLDENNSIMELDESDNTLLTKFNVSSNAVRDLFVYKNQNCYKDQIVLLNPSDQHYADKKILFQISEDENFEHPAERLIQQQKLFTTVLLNDLKMNKRYWYRFKLENAGLPYSAAKSFITSYQSKFLLTDKYSFAGQDYFHTKYSNGRIELANDTVSITVLSAGAYSGSTCVIGMNGINQLTNSYFAGIGLAVFNDKNMNFEYSKWFNLFNNPAAVKELAGVIDSIPAGKIVALGVSDDAANNISLELKKSIKSLGSSKIDSLKFQGSWGMIAKKGGTAADVIEELKDPYGGAVRIEKVFERKFREGKFITQKIGPAARWDKIIIDSLSGNLDLFIIGYLRSGKIDTIKNIPAGRYIDIKKIDAAAYPQIKVGFNLHGNNEHSPGFNSIGVDYDDLPELGINYQTVSFSRDTLNQGEELEISYDTYNAGTSDALLFKIEVNAESSEGITKNVYSRRIDSLVSKGKLNCSIKLDTKDLRGLIHFKINIDTDNEIDEHFEDNNSYSFPVYIRPNTTPSLVKILIDNFEIIDGDYISSKPDIKILLTEKSNSPVNDTSAVDFYLNSKRISYSNNPAVRYYFSESNPKFVVNYAPQLDDGNYQLKVLGKNAFGYLPDSAGTLKKFTVSGEIKLMNLYNYPNPLRENTCFTFELTQVPDELQIKIYTISGRIIKVINSDPFSLRYGFNKIPWDGRDSDSDPVANGIYLYKVILRKGDRSSSFIGKLAVMR